MCPTSRKHIAHMSQIRSIWADAGPNLASIGPNMAESGKSWQSGVGHVRGIGRARQHEVRPGGQLKGDSIGCRIRATLMAGPRFDRLDARPNMRAPRARIRSGAGVGRGASPRPIRRIVRGDPKNRRRARNRRWNSERASAPEPPLLRGVPAERTSAVGAPQARHPAERERATSQTHPTQAKQTSDWPTARRVSQGGGAHVWRTGTRLPGPVPRRWEDGLAAARAEHPAPA